MSLDEGRGQPTPDELDRLATVRDNSLVALGGLYLVASVIYAWAGQPPPPFSVAVFVLLPVVALGTRNLYARSPSRWSAALVATWPAFIAPLVYFAEVRVLEIDRSRYVDAFLLWADEQMGIHLGDGARPWAAGGLFEEVANAFYVSYYLLPFLVVWLTFRHGAVVGARATTALSVATLTCGVIWLALPSGGYYPTGGPTGPGFGPFTEFAHGVYSTHPHFAAAFPSEHVAHVAAFASVMRARGTGAWIWLWVLGVGTATVVGQYHFALDALAGWVVGVFAASAATWFARDRSVVARPQTV